MAGKIACYNKTLMMTFDEGGIRISDFILFLLLLLNFSVLSPPHLFLHSTRLSAPLWLSTPYVLGGCGVHLIQQSLDFLSITRF